ncbi:hypothetical protein LINPERHAP2_LOCUS25492 [Linum perenne]
MDVTREELPNTMAAIRLSGMEISDLTMELSDLGQEITQGVKGSTRVVHVAEEKLRGLVNMDSAPSASLQGVRIPGTKKEEPGLARSARGLKEGIVKGRSLFQLFLTLASFTRTLMSSLSSVLNEELFHMEDSKSELTFSPLVRRGHHSYQAAYT